MPRPGGTAEAAATDDLAAWVERAAELARRQPGIDAFEIRGDTRDNRRHTLARGQLQAAALNRLSGIGIRVTAAGGTSYAHANALSEDGLKDMVARATRLALASGRHGWTAFHLDIDRPTRVVYRPHVRHHPADAEPHLVHDLLDRAAQAAQAERPDMIVQVSFGARSNRIIRTDSAGSWCDIQGLLSTLMVQTVLRDAGRIGDGTEWEGGERGLGDYETDGGPEAIGQRAAQHALESLDAVPLPAGRQRVLCDNHLTGLLTHESFGHLAEYDLVASGWSTIRDRIGERLADETVTIRDAPVAPGEPHQGVRVPYDDEGTEGHTLTILDRGVLTAWMHTRDSAASRDTSPTGNARALDARFAPIVRMRNTYIEPGDATFEEALESLNDGVYLLGARGGMPRSDGSFMFTSKRGYLVRGGEIREPVRPAAIQGNVLDFLKRVELLTRDHHIYTNYFGGCGKWDQEYLHVGTGGPHVLVSEALVGGQGA